MVQRTTRVGGVVDRYLRSERAIAVLETPAARSAPSGPASGAAGDRWASGLNFFSGVAEKVCAAVRLPWVMMGVGG